MYSNELWEKQPDAVNRASIYDRVGKTTVYGPDPVTACFCEESFIEHSHAAHLFILSMAAFVLHWHSWVIVTVTIWPMNA